jgi:DNA-binding PadR family transcriptional regulator
LGADPRRIADQLVAEEKVRHVAVLIFMLYKDPALENDLRKAMAGGRYAVNSQLARIVLSELQEMKLVELIKFGRYKVYRLTPLGREVAEELARRAGFIWQLELESFTARRRPRSLSTPASRAVKADAEVMRLKTFSQLTSLSFSPPPLRNGAMRCLERAAKAVLEALSRIEIVRDPLVATRGAARALLHAQREAATVRVKVETRAASC